jgi:hypothetical protein
VLLPLLPLLLLLLLLLLLGCAYSAWPVQQPASHHVEYGWQADLQSLWHSCNLIQPAARRT